MSTVDDLLGGKQGQASLTSIPSIATDFTYDMFRSLIADLIAKFRDTDGRYYVLLSLDEAEHLRGIIHGRKGRSFIESESALVDCTSAVMWAMGDNDVYSIATTRNVKKPSVAHHTSMVNSFRFMNSDTYFTDTGITTLLRILEKNKCDEREKWWTAIRACRRRRQIALTGVHSITSIFTVPNEFHYMQYKSEIARIRYSLREAGMLIYDAFRAFNSTHTGLLSCSELYGGLSYLHIPFTPDQIYNLVKKIAVDNEVSYLNLYTYYTYLFAYKFITYYTVTYCTMVC